MAALWMPLRLIDSGKREKLRRAALTYAIRGMVFALLFFATAELALRVYFRGGETFGSHVGPIVAEFERDFRCNRFDGPSRGPQVVGPKQPGSVRVMLQGDSITWGQGVRDESRLYSSVLLERLRRDRPQTQLAVLARGGREIDAHLAQIHKWGAQIEPDVILYQWYINDLELEKMHRPRAKGLWRRLLFHPILKQRSYLWFFLDYQLDQLLPASMSYEEYIYKYFGPNTRGWREFETLFRAWASKATSLTSRVAVILYPSTELPSRVQFGDIYALMTELASEMGLVTIELSSIFEALGEDFSSVRASRFDGHPGAEIHARMAEVLYVSLTSTWPDLFALSEDSPVAAIDREASAAVSGRETFYSCKKVLEQ